MANTDMEFGETVLSLLAYEEKGHDRGYQPSIFRVPSVQRDISPSSYTPKVVSIGPLHRGAKNLQEMEARKATYVRNLLASLDLSRKGTLYACVQKVTAKINKIKERYDDMKSYTDDELAKMMVIDGLFILEFVYNFGVKDALLSQSIIEDLVLLENQIPFFVLQDLFECTISRCKPLVFLIELIVDKVVFFVPLLALDVIFFRGTTDPDHILSLLHMCYHPCPKKDIYPGFSDSRIRSAIELDRAGVKFKRMYDSSWMMAMEVEPSRSGCFSWSWGKPTLRMPYMCLNDYTESVMRNLIVYEQSSFDVPTNYITSYVTALDALVDTGEDIAMLMESGVLINLTGSNEEAASIINRIMSCTGNKTNMKSRMDFFYGDQWNELNRYYNGYWPKNIARLKRTYFSSPWNIIALLAGILLFALNIVQTIFTIKAS